MDSDPDCLIAVTGTVYESEILDLNWCAFDISKTEVIEEINVFIKPDREIGSPEDITMRTGIEPADLENAGDLNSAIKQFNSFIFEQMIMNNKAYILVTVGDQLLAD
jgi:DNA polymerase III alpha subunit (gram-positive type)